MEGVSQNSKLIHRLKEDAVMDDDIFAGAPPAKGGLFGGLSPLSAKEEQSKKRELETLPTEPVAKKPREGSTSGTGQQAAALLSPHTALQAAYSEDKGSRTTMEDVAVIRLDAREDESKQHVRLAFFGVFDGHGGRHVAQYAADNLHATVMAAGLAAEAEKAAGTSSSSSSSSGVSVKACRAAITAGFKQLDEAVLKKCAAEGWSDGATAVAVWVVGHLVLVANVGDAKCVLARRPQTDAGGDTAAAGGSTGSRDGCRQTPSSGPATLSSTEAGQAATAGQTAGQQQARPACEGPASGASAAHVASAEQAAGQQQEARAASHGQGSAPAVPPAQQQQPEQFKAITLTREHRAIYPQERQRIERAGGFVSGDGRLAGRVEVSRAFGDKVFKKQGMTALPDIQAFQITARDAFLLCGCDGFWGVFGPQDAVDFAAQELAKGYDLKQTCNRLLYEAIRERHCKDNCTIMLISLTT